MIVTREAITGYAYCVQQLTDGDLVYTLDGIPEGEDRCEGHKQQKVDAIRETVAWTFGDLNGHSSDPMDAMVSGMVQRSAEYIHFANEADRLCPSCGQPRQISDQVRPVYASLGGPRGGADQLFRNRKARREQAQAAQQTASAAERQATALEQLAANAAGPEVAALRGEIDELRAQLEANGNGHGEPKQRASDVAPRPRKRSS